MSGETPDVMANQLVIAVQALRSIRDNVSAQTDWRDIETMAGDAIDAIFVLGAMPEPEPAGPQRYALVEQMGHRATIATIRETTFCGKQMIEATDLKGGGTSLISPESVYEITWLTEADALARTGPWTPAAIAAVPDDDDDDEVAENGGVWGLHRGGPVTAAVPPGSGNDDVMAAELRELAAWYESSARHSKGIRANEQQLCADRIRASVARAARALAAREPDAADGPHHHTSVLECEDCLLRSAVLAEVEAAVEFAYNHHGDVDAEVYVDAILGIVADAYAGTKPEPQAAPELAAAPELREAMAETRAYREAIEHEVHQLETSARISEPSKKSQIENAVAGRLRKILDPR